MASVMDGLPQCLSSEGPGSPSSQGGVGKGGVGDKAVTGVHGPSFILHTHSGAGAPALHLGQRAVQRRCCSGQKLALEAELFISRKSELTQGCAQRKEGRDAVGCAPHAHPVRFPQIHPGTWGPRQPMEMLRTAAPCSDGSRLGPVSTGNPRM